VYVLLHGRAIMQVILEEFDMYYGRVVLGIEATIPCSRCKASRCMKCVQGTGLVTVSSP